MRKICFLLAFLVALTAVAPAHAADAETVMWSEISLVEVTVPQTGRIILNPYGLPTEIDGETTREQIASETMPILNNGDTPVIVSARAAGRISEQSSMVYVTAPPTADTLEKEIFLYAEFQQEGGAWSGSYSGEGNQILITERTSEVQEVLTLDAASQGMFRMFGSTAVFPVDPWCTDDSVSVTFTFTFAPVEMERTEDPAEEEIPEEEAPPAEEAPEEEVPPEEDPSEDPGAPEEPETPDTPEASDPSFPEETEPSEPPAADQDPVPADPPEQDAPEPPETPGEPDPPAEPEASEAQEGETIQNDS